MTIQATTYQKRSGIRKFWKCIFFILSTFLLIVLGLFIYLVIVSKVNPPKPADTSSLHWQRSEPSPGFYTLKNSWLRKNKSGLYEMYVEGGPYERGVVNGKLSKELILKQEDYFNEQINKMIPSKFY